MSPRCSLEEKLEVSRLVCCLVGLAVSCCMVCLPYISIAAEGENSLFQATSSVVLNPHASSAVALTKYEAIGFNDAKILGRKSGAWDPVSLSDLEPRGTSWTTSMRIRDFNTGEEIPVGLGKESLAGFHAWSPDGKWLAYVRKVANEHQLWVVSSDGTLNRRVGDQPINVLVTGQRVQPGFRLRYQFVPFSWAPDSTRLVFASPVGRNRSVDQRIEDLKVPVVRDMRAAGVSEEVDSYYSDRMIATTLYLHNSQVMEATIGKSWAVHVLSAPDSILHIEYVSNSRLLVGSLGQASNQGRHQFYAVLTTQLSNADWRILAVELAVSGRHSIIIDAEGQLVAVSSPGFCSDSRTNVEVIMICPEMSIPQVVITNDSILALNNQSGEIFVYERSTGQLNHRSNVRRVQSDDYVAYSTILTDYTGVAAVPYSDSEILVADMLFDNGVVRGYKISLHDVKSHETSVILDDPTNRNSVVRIGYYLGNDQLLVEYAQAAGQFYVGTFDFLTAERTAISPSIMTRSTFSEFEYVDLNYERKDGFPLVARLFLPNKEKHRSSNRYPMVVWQYPSHANNEDVLIKRLRTRNANRYSKNDDLSYIGSWLPVALLEAGFAVLHYPDFPLVGVDDELGAGTFKRQMIMNAEAAVDAALSTGVVNEKKIAIAGHSRGGGDAALLLAFTDFFGVGISVAGAMNAALTPYYTQYESRPIWEVPDVYLRISASAQPHLINEPLLMIHGMLDDSYARSVASEGMYNGMQMFSGQARLVLVPFMGHEPFSNADREIVWRETIAWLSYYFGSENRTGSPK